VLQFQFSLTFLQNVNFSLTDFEEFFFPDDFLTRGNPGYSLSLPQGHRAFFLSFLVDENLSCPFRPSLFLPNDGNPGYPGHST
jgi:hypothetical protein